MNLSDYKVTPIPEVELPDCRIYWRPPAAGRWLAFQGLVVYLSEAEGTIEGILRSLRKDEHNEYLITKNGKPIAYYKS